MIVRENVNLGIWPFDGANKDTPNIDLGLKAAQYFYDEALGYTLASYSFEEMLSQVGGKDPNIFLDGLGMTIKNIDMSDSQVKDAMVALAKKGQGQIPSSFSYFFSALSDRMVEPTFMDYVGAYPEVTLDKIKEVTAQVKEFGEATLEGVKGITSTAKMLRYGLPVIVIGSLVFFAYLKVKQADSLTTLSKQDIQNLKAKAKQGWAAGKKHLAEGGRRIKAAIKNRSLEGAF